MKQLWMYYRVGGKYVGEVEDTFEEVVPYTSVPPLQGTRNDEFPLTVDDQIFDPYENKWVEIVNALDRNKLNNLEAMYNALETKNVELEKHSEQASALVAKTMANAIKLSQADEALKLANTNLTKLNAKTMVTSVKNSNDIEVLATKVDELDPKKVLMPKNIVAKTQVNSTGNVKTIVTGIGKANGTIKVEDANEKELGSTQVTEGETFELTTTDVVEVNSTILVSQTLDGVTSNKVSVTVVEEKVEEEK